MPPNLVVVLQAGGRSAVRSARSSSCHTSVATSPVGRSYDAGIPIPLQGRVTEVRPDEDGRYMDPISVKYTGESFPAHGPDLQCNL